MDFAYHQKSGGSSTTKRKRKDEDDSLPAGKGKRGLTAKSQQSFEKLITDAEMDVKVHHLSTSLIV